MISEDTKCIRGIFALLKILCKLRRFSTPFRWALVDMPLPHAKQTSSSTPSTVNSTSGKWSKEWKDRTKGAKQLQHMSPLLLSKGLVKLHR